MVGWSMFGSGVRADETARTMVAEAIVRLRKNVSV